MFLVPINILTFHFNPSKILLQLLTPIKFSISIFNLIFVFINENYGKMYRIL